MNKKQLRDIAIAVLIVFVVTVIVYPLIFNTDPHPKSEPPVQLEVHK
jgi:hypothetical protein